MVRVKTRYLTCKLWPPPAADATAAPPSRAAILKAIRDSIQANFGDFGASALLASLQVRYYDEATRVFVVRCKREAYRQAWAAMTLVTAVGWQRGSSIGVLRVSGSVRLCREDALAILLAAAGISDPELPAAQEYKRQLEAAVQGV